MTTKTLWPASYSVLRAFLATLTVTICAAAHAMPVQWVLQDVIFDDGGTASGSFVYDADTNTFSSIFVTTTDGGVLSGSVYEFANFEAGLLDADSVLLVAAANPGAGTAAFNMNLDEAMTNAGGTINIALAPPPLGFESTCLTSVCDAFFNLDRVVVSGSITAVPLPAAAWLLASGLTGLAGLRRRSSACGRGGLT